MTTREKTIGAVVGLAIGLYALDQLLFDPLIERLNAADTKTTDHQTKLAQNSDVLRKRSAASHTWKDLAGDRVRGDSSAAESQMSNAVREASQRARVALPSWQSEKADKDQGYDRWQLTVTANGNMEQMARFLFELQTCDVPIRISQMQFKSKNDGKDDLTLTLKLTTIFQAIAPAVTPPKVALGETRREAL